MVDEQHVYRNEHAHLSSKVIAPQHIRIIVVSITAAAAIRTFSCSVNLSSVGSAILQGALPVGNDDLLAVWQEDLIGMSLSDALSPSKLATSIERFLELAPKNQGMWVTLFMWSFRLQVLAA